MHSGHASLIKQSQKDNQKTVVSIFVNPTQFNNPEDFNTYPKNFENDFSLLKDWGVDVLFFPKSTEIYSDNFKFVISEKDVSKILCGAHRPGHFDGVLTVVMKLLNIIKPQNAYFGEKDYQQYLLILKMVEAFFVPTSIISCPIIREGDGLAMSSRNVRLSPSGRALAPQIFTALKSSASVSEVKEKLTSLGIDVEYCEEHWGRIFIAVFLENVRLIDNVPLS